MATMTAIQTVTVGAGGAANITFSNIPQTYTDLCIVVSSRKSLSTGLGYSSINFNGDTGSNYGYVFLNGAGTTTYQNLTTPSTFLFFSSDDQANTANTFGSATVYIPNYVSNTGFKSVYTHCVSENNSAASAFMDLHSGIWRSTSSITSITLADLITSSSFVQYSTATLYGVFRGPETFPSTPTIGTATAGNQSASVAFTPTSATDVDASYTVLSTPGSIVASGTSSPITVSGLTNGTTYTFQVRANNPGRSSTYSAASNSATPVTPPAPTAIELFVVAGGGGSQNGGGGAGGLCYQASRSVSAGTTYSVTIGGGGVGRSVNTGAAGANGSNSVFNTITAVGGGSASSSQGSNGGSGSGGYSDASLGGTATQGSSGGATGYGFNGSGGGNGRAGGGGGAGAAAPSYASAPDGQVGGVGRQYWNENGTATYYAGGGGGRNYGNGTAFAGGAGGGGAGNTTPGTANTGGGAGTSAGGSANGGSGVVVLRFPVGQTIASTTGSPTTGTDATYRYYKFTGDGSITI